MSNTFFQGKRVILYPPGYGSGHLSKPQKAFAVGLGRNKSLSFVNDLMNICCLSRSFDAGSSGPTSFQGIQRNCCDMWLTLLTMMKPSRNHNSVPPWKDQTKRNRELLIAERSSPYMQFTVKYRQVRQHFFDFFDSPRGIAASKTTFCVRNKINACNICLKSTEHFLLLLPLKVYFLCHMPSVSYCLWLKLYFACDSLFHLKVFLSRSFAAELAWNLLIIKVKSNIFSVTFWRLFGNRSKLESCFLSRRLCITAPVPVTPEQVGATWSPSRVTSSILLVK